MRFATASAIVIIMKMKYVFWLAASLVGYSYLGYPAWLWLRSRWSPRPVRRGFGRGLCGTHSYDGDGRAQ